MLLINFQAFRPAALLKEAPTQTFSCEYCKSQTLTFQKKFFFICFDNSPSKMMKNAFYFILKDLFILKIFKFLS